MQIHEQLAKMSEQLNKVQKKTDMDMFMQQAPVCRWGLTRGNDGHFWSVSARILVGKVCSLVL